EESLDHVTAESRIGREVETVLDKLEKIRSLEGKNAGRSILRMIEGGGANEKIVLFLKSLRNYDDYTFAHSVNVAVISTATARHIGFDEAAAGRIGLAALLHDIGKIYVPRHIIRKNGRLSPSEWQIIRRHPVDGARILQGEDLEEDLWRVAYEHHMQYDLSGYPNMKEGDSLLDASHIVRIADTYDALTTKRAYRKQISPYEAIKLMSKTRGSEFHPEYFDTFMHMMGNIPIGSTLELETGETVLVVDIEGRTGMLPRVKLLRTSEGRPVEGGKIIDLNEIDPRTRKRRYRIIRIENSPVRDVEIGKYLVRS
ncbi:MAG TPA: HD domain-containing phosphohydrolase, partial [Candidatus Krumholzibacterium sp.]|nr:HD domain-containing phosphohydrolase [Candidatus Krumholzibacterium sp.]